MTKPIKLKYGLPDFNIEVEYDEELYNDLKEDTRVEFLKILNYEVLGSLLKEKSQLNIEDMSEDEIDRLFKILKIFGIVPEFIK